MRRTSFIYESTDQSALQQPKQSDRFPLRLLATTDLHVSLTGYDYYRDQHTIHMGLSRTAALIAQARDETINHLLFDNGDILQGNPLGDYAAEQRYWQNEQTGAGVHPLIELMNRLDYDAATLGNHEFNYGLDYLQQCIAGAYFPYTNANVEVLDGQQRHLLLPPYVLLHRTLHNEEGDTAELCIGVIGIVPPQIMNWDRNHLEGRVEAHDMVEAARAAIAAARQAGADIIVLLAHCGYVEQDAPTISENAVLPLSRLAGVDALFFGHAHKVFPGAEFAGRPGVNLERGTIYGVPAAEPGVWGSHLGVIDLELERSADGWSVVASCGTVRPIVDPVLGCALVEPVAELEQVAQAAHEQTLHYIHTPVGQLDVSLHSYFALVTDTAIVQLINEAQRELGRQLLAGTPYSSLPLLSAAAPFKTGGRYGPLHYTAIEPGALTLRHMADIYSYANTFCIVRLNGDEVREWLEWSAGLYATLVPDDERQELLHAAFSPFNFDVIDGLSYRIDVSMPPRYNAEGELINSNNRRIVELTYNGELVTGAMEFAVATNQYRAFSTPLANPDGQRVIVDAGIENRQVLIDYVRHHGRIQPVADHNWSLCYGSGQQMDTQTDMLEQPSLQQAQAEPVASKKTIYAVFQSSPDARQWLDEYPQFAPVGLEANGFATYRISLKMGM
ncbi:bifunctional 2',3'-cyclic-nucleotide 2'-phosphodiesterase/3'-nucleotidase [Paenibacillus campi]|uniref:bifunctional 2',3'-cyclic-nucleotide 2'-phosphodiesterase/3'-nucleotidase n=1 Tax=Paenibacillus campi TaxID=3106031 RepID=UPI002AFE730C|nr:bifunctional 2',3'-cyclic-nucleotide 2'-phosphodiesterase/3'-nucleotidase [Paenibacillus sp. SGZ-1014]